MKLASLLSAAVFLIAAGVAFCSDESPSENASALVPDELLPLYTYYSTIMNFRPCEHGCGCTDLVLSNNTECTEMMLSSAGVDPTYDCKKTRFKVECAVSLSLILKQPYSSWDLECLDDLLLCVPSNTTDIVVSNFQPVRMSCGRKLQDSAQFKWPWSDSHNPKELLTLTVKSSEIRDFSSDAFSLNLFASLVSIHIKNSDFVTFDEPQLHKKIFSGLPSLEIITVVNNTNLRVIPTTTFSYLPQLKVINLTENSIKAIEQRAFGTRVRTVIANPKNISSISVTELGAASSLPQLTVLDLSHNSLQSLPRQDILELSNGSLRYLYLEGNPWNCSCEMAWIVELNTSILAGPPGVCHYPSFLRGTALQQLNPKHFEHCFPVNSFSFNTIMVTVTLAVICITALLFNRIYYLHTSKISIGQIEFDTKDSLGPNTFRGNMKDGRSIVVKRRSRLETKHSSELKIFLSLSYHSNVIQYLLREETNSVLYIALKLCSGNLQDLLIDAIKENNNKVLQQLASREYLCQIAKGLCHLHSNGIEHRDLRPVNILCGVNTSGNLKIIISNFYMGCFTGRPSSLIDPPHEYRCRTRGWCAPELWDGDTEVITTAVDIFSMGCVFFYMLTRGGHPFGSLEDSILLQKNIMMADQISLNRLVDRQKRLKELAKEKLGKDLIKSMIQHEASERPNIYDVLQHQLLWDSKQQLQFKCKVVVGQIEYDSRESLSVNVYRGKLRNNNRPVAVKKVPFFQQCEELDILLSMPAHTNVIQYLWKEDDGETLFLAFELGKGNLRDLIPAESIPNLLDIKNCLHQITEGVRHLHECAIPVQHRDIKPTNILWTLDNQHTSGKRFFVSDFDLSRFCGDPSSNKSHYGTEGWSAPEMWDTERGSRTIAADIFSLGCVYFYVLTGGRHPFGMLNNRRELQNSIMINQVSLGCVLTEKFGCYEGELSEVLIVSMIQGDISKRPTARKILKHLFFWGQKEIANFYDQVGNCLEKAETSAFFVEKLEHNSDEVIQGDWRARLDKIVRSDVKSYDKSKMYALLRVVRNKYVHYKDFGPELKAAYDRRGGVVAYYHYHFPKLLLHTYLAAMQVKDQLPSQLRNNMS